MFINFSMLFDIKWVIADFGCQTFSMVAVPLYDTLGEEAMEHTIKVSKYSKTVWKT